MKYILIDRKAAEKHFNNVYLVDSQKAILDLLAEMQKNYSPDPEDPQLDYVIGLVTCNHFTWDDCARPILSLSVAKTYYVEKAIHFANKVKSSSQSVYRRSIYNYDGILFVDKFEKGSTKL